MECFAIASLSDMTTAKTGSTHTSALPRSRTDAGVNHPNPSLQCDSIRRVLPGFDNTVASSSNQDIAALRDEK